MEELPESPIMIKEIPDSGIINASKSDISNDGSLEILKILKQPTKSDKSFQDAFAQPVEPKLCGPKPLHVDIKHLDFFHLKQ